MEIDYGISVEHGDLRVIQPTLTGTMDTGARNQPFHEVYNKSNDRS